MARTLKSSGLALNLVTCLGVDDDNTTIKDFTGKAVTPHANVTKSTATWKGTTYPFFQTYSVSSTSPAGVAYDAPPTVAGNDADGFSAFVVCMGMDAATGSSGVKTIINIDLAASPNLRGFHSRNGAGGAQLGMNAGSIGSTVLPSDLSTKFSVGANFKYNENSSEVFYGLESGSLASDSATSTPASGDAANFLVNYVGGYAGQNTQPGKYALVCVFNRKLTLAEFQSLHNDPFGTLFVTASPPNAPTIGTTTAIGNTGATINWTDNSADETGFKVEWSPSPYSTWTAASNSPAAANATSLAITGLTAATTYKARVAATNAGGDSAWVETATFTTTNTVKKLKLKIDASAAGATNISGVVWAAQTGAIAGAEIGEFTGQTFEAALEGGQAVLKVPVSAFGGGSLTVSDTPVALVRNATNTSGIVSCTVIEE